MHPAERSSTSPSRWLNRNLRDQKPHPSEDGPAPDFQTLRCPRRMRDGARVTYGGKNVTLTERRRCVVLKRDLAAIEIGTAALSPTRQEPLILPLSARSSSHAGMTASGVKQQQVPNRRADRAALHPCRHGRFGGQRGQSRDARSAGPGVGDGEALLVRPRGAAAIAPGQSVASRSIHQSRYRSR